MADQGKYIVEILSKLAGSPTTIDLDYLVSAHTTLGYLSAQAETAAEMAEAQRKYEEATASSIIRSQANQQQIKITADAVAAEVTQQCFAVKQDEIAAYEKARKLKNLLESVTQAINAIKFLGKYDATPSATILDRIPGR